MKIFLFRHGTIDNPNDVLPGRLPGFHLSEIGREQVRKTAESLKKENIVSIYSSPLERTLETAEIIAKVIGLDTEDIEIANEVMEVESLRWQGKKKDDFEKNSQYIKNPLVTSDMESRKDSGKRVYDFLKNIAKNNENVVLVSHGDPIMGAIGWITNKWEKIDDNYIKRGEYYTIKIDDNKWNVDF